MVTTPTNVTGWSELMDGHMVQAVYTMFNTAMGNTGWPVIFLFFTYQIMLFIKTRNLTLMWITGIIFASMYGLSVYVEPFSVQIMFLLLVFELGGILYMLLFQR
jgi:hypothetical protein